MTVPHTSGTITLVKGSADVTGIDTGWAAALIVGGVLFVNVANVGAFALPIKTVDSNTKITAAIPWNGANGTYTYALVRDGSYERQSVENAIKTATLLNEIRSLALTNLSTLTPAADKLPYFGPGGAGALTDFNAAARALLAGGVLADGQLPARLRLGSATITNANTFRESGWAAGNNVTGAPTNTGDGDWYTYENVIAGQSWGYQRAVNWFSDKRYIRFIRGGTWDANWKPDNSERGSNANGQYVRLADGTQICTGFFVGYTGDAVKIVPMAASFATPVNASSYSLLPAGGIDVATAPSWCDDGANFKFFSGNSFPTNRVDYFVIGRWF